MAIEPEAQAASWRAVGRPREGRIDVDQEGAEVALHGVELGGEVADVADLDVLRARPVASRRAAAHASRIIATMCLFSLVQLRREVGLVAAENVDWRCHRVSFRAGGLPTRAAEPSTRFCGAQGS